MVHSLAQQPPRETKGQALPLTVDRVENSGLAERLLILGRRIAAIVTVLMAANAVIRVCLIWLSRKRLDVSAERERETYEVVPVEGLGSKGRECAGGSTCGSLCTSGVRRNDKCERY